MHPLIYSDQTKPSARKKAATTSPDEKTNVINDADLDAAAGGLTIEEMYEKMKEELDSGVEGRFLDGTGDVEPEANGFCRLSPKQIRDQII